MASISTDKQGNRRILFAGPNRKRKIIYLGGVPMKTAREIKAKVENLAAALLGRHSPDAETSEWLGTLDDTLYGKLVRGGLVPPRQPEASEPKPQGPTVAEFIDGYLATRGDLKPATLTVMKQARVWLVRHLGSDRSLSDVTVADADAYKAGMVKKGLARATIAKRCRYARHFFAVALRRKLIDENPFAHIKGAVKGDPARRVFVPAETIVKVMEFLPNAQWKLLVALGRWGGLRIPSETAAMKWQDVDIPGRRFIVRASKTEHHEDGGIRQVPMFPELVPLFEQVYDEAPEGAVYVFDRFRENQNTRTMFARYIEKTGFVAWRKPFQNLRVSRATELADQYPSHVCAAWLGHSEKVADSFYRQVTDEHFTKATAAGGASSNSATHIPTQQPPGNAGKSWNEQKQPLEKPGISRGCNSVQAYQWAIRDSNL